MPHNRVWLKRDNPFAVLHNNSNNDSNAAEGVDNSALVLRSALADVNHVEYFTESFPAMSTLSEDAIKASVGLAASTAVLRSRTLKENFKTALLDNRILHYQFHNGAFDNDPEAAKKLVMHNMAMQRYLFGLPPLSNSQAGGAFGPPAALAAPARRAPRARRGSDPHVLRVLTPAEETAAAAARAAGAAAVRREHEVAAQDADGGEPGAAAVVAEAARDRRAALAATAAAAPPGGVAWLAAAAQRFGPPPGAGNGAAGNGAAGNGTGAELAGRPPAAPGAGRPPLAPRAALAAASRADLAALRERRAAHDARVALEAAAAGSAAAAARRNAGASAADIIAAAATAAAEYAETHRQNPTAVNAARAAAAAAPAAAAGNAAARDAAAAQGAAARAARAAAVRRAAEAGADAARAAQAVAGSTLGAITAAAGKAAAAVMAAAAVALVEKAQRNATAAFTAQVAAAEAGVAGAVRRGEASYAPPSDIDFADKINGLDAQFNITAKRLEDTAELDWWHENERFFKDVLPKTFISIYNELKWALGSVKSYTDANNNIIKARREAIKLILQGTFWTATPTSLGALQGAEVAEAGAEEAPAVEKGAAALAVPAERLAKEEDLMEKAWGTGAISKTTLEQVGLTYPLPSIKDDIGRLLRYLDSRGDDADTYYELIDRLIKLILNPRTRDWDIPKFLAGFKALYEVEYDPKFDQPIGMTLATHLKSLFASRATVLEQAFVYSYNSQDANQKAIDIVVEKFFDFWDLRCREIVRHLQDDTRYAGLERYVWRFGSWMPSANFFKKTSALKAIYETGFERYSARAAVVARKEPVEQVQYPSGPNKTKLHRGVSIVDTQGRWTADRDGDFYPRRTREIYTQLFYENPNEFLGPDTLFCVKPNAVFVEYMRHLDELHAQNGFELELGRLETIQKKRAVIKAIAQPVLRAAAGEAAAVAADPARRAAALAAAQAALAAGQAAIPGEANRAAMFKKVAGISASAQDIANDLAAAAASAVAPLMVKAGVGAAGATAAAAAGAAAVPAAAGVCVGSQLLCTLGAAAPPVGAALLASAAVYGIYRYATALPPVTDAVKERHIEMTNFIRRRDIIAGLVKPSFRDVRETHREEGVFEMLASEGVASLVAAVQIEVGKRGLFADSVTKGVSSILQNFQLCKQTAQANIEARRNFIAVRAANAVARGVNWATGSLPPDAVHRCVDIALSEANAYLATLRRHNVAGRQVGLTTVPDYVRKGIRDIETAFRGATPAGKVVKYEEDPTGSVGIFLLQDQGAVDEAERARAAAAAAAAAGPKAGLAPADQLLLDEARADEAERLAGRKGERNAARLAREQREREAAVQRRAAATADRDAAAERAGAEAKARSLGAEKREVDPATGNTKPLTAEQMARGAAAAASAIEEYKARNPVLGGGRRKSRKGGAARFGRTTARSTALYNVPSTNTIEAVKARIQNKEGIPSNQQRLIFTGLNNSPITQGPVDLNLPPEVLVLKYVDLNRLLVGTTLQEFVSNLFDIVLDTPQLRYVASYYTYKVNTLTHIMLPKYMPVDNLDTQLVSMSKRFTSPLRGGAGKPPRPPPAAAPAATGFSIGRVPVERSALVAPPPLPAALAAAAAKGDELGAMVAAAAAAPVAPAHEDVADPEYEPTAAAPSNWPDYLKRRDEILESLQSSLLARLTEDAPRVQAVLKEQAVAYNGILETFTKDRAVIAGIKERAKADAAAANTAATSQWMNLAGGVAQLAGWATGSSTLMEIGKGVFGAKNLTTAGAAVLAPLTRDGLEAAAKAKQQQAEDTLKAKSASASDTERAAARKDKHAADIDYIGSLLMSDKAVKEKYAALEAKLRAAAPDDEATITLYSEALVILIDGESSLNDEAKAAWKAAVGTIIETKTKFAAVVAAAPAPAELASSVARRELAARAANARAAAAAASSGAPPPPKSATPARAPAAPPPPQQQQQQQPPPPPPAEVNALAEHLRGISAANRLGFFTGTHPDRLKAGNTPAQKAALWEWATQAGATGASPTRKNALIKKVKEQLANPVAATGVAPAANAAARAAALAAPSPAGIVAGAPTPRQGRSAAVADAARQAPPGGSRSTRKRAHAKKRVSTRKSSRSVKSRQTLKNRRRRRQLRKTYH